VGGVEALIALVPQEAQVQRTCACLHRSGPSGDLSHRPALRGAKHETARGMPMALGQLRRSRGPIDDEADEPEADRERSAERAPQANTGAQIQLATGERIPVPGLAGLSSV